MITKDIKQKLLLTTAVLVGSAFVVGNIAPKYGFTIPYSYLSIWDLKKEKEDILKKTESIRKNEEAATKKLSETKKLEVSVLKEENQISNTLQEFETLKQSNNNMQFDVPSLLIRLEQLAKKQNIELLIDTQKLIQSNSQASGGNQQLVKTDVDIQIKGNYQKIIDYIEDVENVPFITVESTKVNTESQDTFGSITIGVFHY